jgi:uncharacterized membrane protein YdjX (TVP38/TMEM64 family)
LGKWQTRAVRTGIGLALVALLVLFLQNTDQIALWLRWMEEQGPLGHLWFALFYVLATLVMVPASILEASAGFLYGPLWGIPIASALGTASATLSFVLGRTVLRSIIERRLARDGMIAQVDSAIGQHGMQLVVLLRLSPLTPFNVFNYGLGLSRISALDFAVGTAIGHLFPVIVFTWTGSTVADATALADGPSLPRWATVVGLVLTVIATVGVTRFARRALQGTLAPSSGPV